METADAPALLAWLRQREDEMTDLLERLVRAESPTVEPETQRAPYAILAAELERSGLHTRAIKGTEMGDALYARPRRRARRVPFQLLLGHMDTVWPVGKIASMPVRKDDGMLYGPGVYDMKGGLVQLVFALHALHAGGLVPEATPVVLVNADEEVGSRESARTIRRLAAAAARAFVLEPAYGPTGRLKTGRKGVGRFELKVTGRAAHAGSEPEAGISAILELSHQIQRLFELNDAERGITVNVGTIDGGLRANVIPPEASALIDARVVTLTDAIWIEQQIRGLTPTQEGITLTVTGGLGRPPMEPTRRNRDLYARAADLAGALGFEVEEATIVGGASDANIASGYTATLDGLGPVGDGSHAPDEHVVIASLPQRAALLALLLLSPVSRPAEKPSQAAAGALVS